MRKLSRLRTNGIPQAFRGPDRVNKSLELLKAERELKKGLIEKHKFPSNWSPSKKQLQKESHQKCAYCESPTTVTAYGDVEHYRPKSKYWWLAYCYDNYLASCQLCNQKYKKAKFDIHGTQLSPPQVRSNSTDTRLAEMASQVTPDPINSAEGLDWQVFEQMHFTERPLLLNPYIDDPSAYFSWEVDHVSKQVRLIANDDTDDLKLKMVKAAEKDYGINRKELCAHRYDAYLIYSVARLVSEDHNLPAHYRQMNLTIKNKVTAPEAAYSGMIAHFEQVESALLALPE